MAKPIQGTPVLKGKAAKNFVDYIKNAKADPKKEKRHESLRLLARTVKVSD